MSTRLSVVGLLALSLLVSLVGCGGGGGGSDSAVWQQKADDASSALDQGCAAFDATMNSSGSMANAAAAAAASLGASGATDVSVDEGSVTFKSHGIECSIVFGVEGRESEGLSSSTVAVQGSTRALPSNKNALVLNPDPWAYSQMPLRVRTTWERLGYSVDYYEGENANLEAFAKMSQYGAVFFTGHGNRGVLLTGQYVSDSEIDPQTLALIEDGQVGISTHHAWSQDGQWGWKHKQYSINAKFIGTQGGNYPGSLIIAYTCLTAADNQLANSFATKGAQVYVAWDNKVTLTSGSSQAQAMVAFIDGLAQGKNVGDAVNAAGDSHLKFEPSTGSLANLTDTPQAIAVTSPGYDDIGATLESLGYQIQTLDTGNVASAADFDGIGV